MWAILWPRKTLNVAIHAISLGFGAFAEAEAFNPAFRPGHPKMRLTVDVDEQGAVDDETLSGRLAHAFPGMRAHACHAEGLSPLRGGVTLVSEDPAANRAHLLEHLMLEMLSFLDGVRRLSGVTCAYQSPPSRSDIFVECEQPDSGSLVALMAVDAMNTALAGDPLEPEYPDMLLCARELRARAASAWLATGLARATGLPTARATAALEGLSRVRVVRQESYNLNLSGEPLYRFVGV